MYKRQGSLSGEAEYFRAVADWLMGSAAAEDTESSSVSAFLNAMNSFDLNEYIRAIHFDELCVDVYKRQPGDILCSLSAFLSGSGNIFR